MLPRLLLCGWVFASGAAMAQETPPTDKQEHAELLAAAKRYHLRLPKERTEAVLREQPLLNFTNPERNQERGSIFVWLHGSRPIAVGQLFRFNSPRGRITKHAFHSLSQSPLIATFDEQIRWSPTAPGVTWQNIPDAPEPAETHAARLLQMRQLARRYRFTLTSNKGESTELRLTARPLFDYEDSAHGVLSGAFLSYVIATDPEALLLLEAEEDKASGKRKFRCAFARLHFQQIVALDGETEVWRVDYDPSMMVNQPGSPATVNKIYNSFYHDP